MKVFRAIESIYKKAGFHLRIGLNPCTYGWDAAPFGVLFGPDGAVNTGGGSIAIDEVGFIESLAECLQPKSILVIGNSFGLSTLALALAWPQSRVVAIDCGAPTFTLMHRIMDPDLTARRLPSDFGITLTRTLAVENGLDIRVVQGYSPQDLGLAKNEQSSLFDLVFIDGDHRNSQVVADFLGARDISTGDCVYVFHDVINWDLESGVRECARISGLNQMILTRTSSGMGVLFPDGHASLNEHLAPYAERADLIRSLRGRSMSNWLFRLVRKSNTSRVVTTLRTWLRST